MNDSVPIDVENTNILRVSSYFPGFDAFAFGFFGAFALAAAALAAVVEDGVELQNVAAKSSERDCAFSFCLALCSASSSAVLSNSACIHGLTNTPHHITAHHPPPPRNS